MSFSTENIHDVEAMPFPLGRLHNGQIVGLPGLVLVRWQSDETGKVYQVYVNGILAGMTCVDEQRMMLVEYDDTHPAAIEVISVAPAFGQEDFSGRLQGFGHCDGSHVVLQWPRKGSLPLDGVVQIYRDSGCGETGMELIGEILIWPNALDKWGWGCDAFGNGDFGYSGAAAPGWGIGCFGEGEFGFDAVQMTFESEPLAEGHYYFLVRLINGRGNIQEGDMELYERYVDPLPTGGELKINGYDSENNQLRLMISSID